MIGNRNAVFTVLLISICFSAPALKAEPLLKDDAYKMGEIICQMIAANGKKKVDSGMRSFFQNCMTSVNQTLSKAQTFAVLKKDEPVPAAAGEEAAPTAEEGESKPRIYENYIDSKFIYDTIQRLCSAERYEKAGQLACFKQATAVLQKDPAMAQTVSCQTAECYESGLRCEVSFSLMMSNSRTRKEEIETLISRRGYPISVAFFRWMEMATAEVSAENVSQARNCLKSSYAFNEKKADQAETRESIRLILANLQSRFRERASNQTMLKTNQ